MTAPLPTPAEVEGMRERHVALAPDVYGVVWCATPTCSQPWPCDAARLLALVDETQKRYLAEIDSAVHALAEVGQLRARLADMLAECDAADSQALASTARTFDGEPFPVLLDPDRIRRLATGEAS